MVGRISHRVDADRDREIEALHEIVRYGDPLRKRLRLRIAHVLRNIVLHLPFVEWMRFADIDGEEIGAVFVLVIHFDQITDLAAEGRSSIATKDQDERARANVVADAEGGIAVE